MASFSTIPTAQAFYADSRNVGSTILLVGVDGAPAPTEYILWFVADTKRDGVPTSIEEGRILGTDDVLVFEDHVDGMLLGDHPGKHQRLNINVPEAFSNAHVYVYLWAVPAKHQAGEEGQYVGFRNLGSRPPPTFGNADWSITEPLTANQFQVQPLDADDDNLPDRWELTHFGGVAVAAASDDTDGDGQDNRAEFQAGTVPVDSSSVLRILSLRSFGPEWRIGFSSVSGKVYQVECCDDLQPGNWRSLTNGLLGNGGTIEVLDPTADAVLERFYRLRLGEQ